LNLFKSKRKLRNKLIFQDEEITRDVQDISNYSLEEIKEKVMATLGNSPDLKAVEGKSFHHELCFFYLESMIDHKSMKEGTSKLLSQDIKPIENENAVQAWSDACKDAFGGVACKQFPSTEEIYQEIVNGSVVMVINQLDQAISINMENAEKRSVTEPTTQTVIRGPKDGFIESLSTNMSLIRKRLRSKNLHFESFRIGKTTQTIVYIGFIKGIANEATIQEVRDRLNRINVSGVFESGNVEELISDKSFTFFPLALNTERPDTVAANLIDGKIVILTDGTPFALIVPAVLVNFFTSSEDYYQNFFLSSFLRFIRYLSFMIALLTPSVYISLLTFHQELVPTSLLISVIAQREGVPFPAVVEVLIMEITFEILREAGVRMPKVVGQMVSIVGALVIGQAAAEAGIISNIMIIVVAITAIANFVAPNYTFASASRLIRFILILASSVLGFYGVIIMLVLMVAHLSSLRSFGVPYLAPVAPFIIEDQKDVLFRFPFWALTKRPTYLKTEQDRKVFSESNPSPPPMEGGDTK
jgi:spore germination protein KA